MLECLRNEPAHSFELETFPGAGPLPNPSPVVFCILPTYEQEKIASGNTGVVPRAGSKGRQAGRFCGRKGFCREADEERTRCAGKGGEYCRRGGTKGKR